MAIQLAMDEHCLICQCGMVTDMHNCVCTGCGNCVQLPRDLTAKYRHKERIHNAAVRKLKRELKLHKKSRARRQ